MYCFRRILKHESPRVLFFKNLSAKESISYKIFWGFFAFWDAEILCIFAEQLQSHSKTTNLKQKFKHQFPAVAYISPLNFSVMWGNFQGTISEMDIYNFSFRTLFMKSSEKCHLFSSLEENSTHKLFFSACL